MSTSIDVISPSTDYETCDEPLPTVCGGTTTTTTGESFRRPRGSHEIFDHVHMLELFGPSARFLCRCATSAVILAIAFISFGVSMKLTASHPTKVNTRTVASFVGLLLGGCSLGLGLMSGVIALYVRHHRRHSSARPLLMEETTIRSR